MTTDKNEIICQIQEMLGPNGSREIAEALLHVLLDRECIDFDGHDGYYFTREISEHQWMDMLAVAAADLAEETR